MDFVDKHRREHGVESICRQLEIASSTYYEWAARRIDPSLRPNRAISDERFKVKIERIWAENRRLYGARKVWHALRKEGESVARCTVERLMRELGIRGVVRKRKKKTASP